MGKEELIQLLAEKINDCNDGYDDVSWGMQEGILLSKGQVMKILAEINKPILPTRKQLVKVINKVVDEHQCLGAEHIADGIIDFSERKKEHKTPKQI